jgi:site-specific recombinase XerD
MRARGGDKLVSAFWPKSKERRQMLDDGSDDEAQCQHIREENGALLGEFSTWLADAGLSTTTIRSHRYNVDFFVNHFLLSYDTLRPAEGIGSIAEFLGDWFIRKAAWSSARSIKANAASLKKFYTFMMEKGHIKPEDLSAMNRQIKEEMPEWLGTMERYRDLDVDPLDIWPS